MTATNKIVPAKNGEVKPTNTLDTLNVRLAELAESMQVLQNTADAEHRPLSADEMKQHGELMTEFNNVETEIKIRAQTAEADARVRAMREPMPRQSIPDGVEQQGEGEPARPYGSIGGGLPPGTSKSSHGFRSLGEFSIAAFRTKAGKHDQRIMNAPTTFGSEGINQDGGFAVPPEFRQNIMKQVLAEDSLLGRCDQQITSSNSLALPLDNTTPWQTSGGVQANWTGEGGVITGSKPQLGQLETKLHKLAALVPITDELLADVPSLTNWLNTKVPEKFTSTLNDALVNGNGVAKPMGLLNAGCKVTVTAESGQGAGTIVAKNIANMWSRMYGRLRPNALWLMNQDIEPQLAVMTMPGTTPAYPVYLQPGGFSQQPYGQIYGRPVLPLEACQTVGTEGDLILVDPTQYLVALKSDGMRSDVSIHLYFDTDHTTFRFIMRVGGQSYWPNAIARQNGSNSLSPVITLSSTRT